MTRLDALALALVTFLAATGGRTVWSAVPQVPPPGAVSIRHDSAAAQYLVQANRTLGEFVPTRSPVRAPMPATPDIAATVEKVAAMQIEDGEMFAIDLDHLTTRTRTRTLAGGIEAAFVPRKTRGKKVQVELVFHHGDEKSLMGKATVAEMTADLAERGTKRLTYQALEDRLAELTANVSVGGGAGEITVRITTVRESLPAVIDVVAEMLKTPAFAAKELEVVRREAISERTSSARGSTRSSRPAGARAAERGRRFAPFGRLCARRRRPATSCPENSAALSRTAPCSSRARPA